MFYPFFPLLTFSTKSHGEKGEERECAKLGSRAMLVKHFMYPPIMKQRQTLVNPRESCTYVPERAEGGGKEGGGVRHKPKEEGEGRGHAR